jgi:hypothetical protein
MKTELESTITTKLYTCKVVRNNETISTQSMLLSYTKLSSLSIETTSKKELVKQLIIVGKYHNLNIENFDEFKFAIDCLKSAISWN